MHKTRAALVGLLCLVAITGCYTNTSQPDVTFTTVATMQLAVGTLNDTAGVLESGATGGPLAPGTYLNAVETFRNQAGNSAFINPGVATLVPGAGAGNLGSLFSYGQAPGHNGTNSAPPSFKAPFTGTGYLVDNLVGGLPPLGAAGTAYSISTNVSVSGQIKHYSASSTLASVSGAYLLPAPAACGYVADGAGGGTLTCPAAPAGVEQVMMVLFGADISSGVAGAVEVPAGATSTVVPDGTFTPGAATAFMINADYPFVEAGPVNSPAVGTATPTITNVGVAVPNGQADMSAGAYFGVTL